MARKLIFKAAKMYQCYLVARYLIKPMPFIAWKAGHMPVCLAVVEKMNGG